MKREPGLKWLFLDLNSYFASVEQQERPALRGKPVAVVPMPTDSTCAIASSYEAKAYGVKTGTKIYEARKMCPNLHCVLARHDLYVDYHNRIIEEVVRHTPINKIWSIDELSSRLPPGKRNPDSAREVARKIKEGLRKNVGEMIRCSVGFAPNSLLAKMAKNMQKPDGLVLIRQEDLPDAIMDLDLRDIPGVGANMEIRLHRAGITNMEKLLKTSPKQARKIWGSVEGERLWYWLHGYDFDRAETGSVMIGHSRVLDPALRAPDMARLMARRLLVKATYRLRRQGFHAGSLSLGVRTVAGYHWAKETRLPPAQDPFTFLRHLDDLWKDMMSSFAPGPRPMMKKIYVGLHQLRAGREIMDDLFHTAPHEKTDLKKKESLARALDTLQQKYQKETVWLGTIPKTVAGHVGTKIAFSRVPEREEFWS